MRLASMPRSTHLWLRIRRAPSLDRATKMALWACAWGAALALSAAAVRVLPWMLDPRVPWRVLTPFARSIALLAGEAALLVGAPVGWALAGAYEVESGEARVFSLLGEPPWRTALRSGPRVLLFALVLALVSLAGGRDASAPGAVVTELVAAGRETCAQVETPSIEVVPFLSAEWLCAPGRAPRLVATSPIGKTTITAADATVAGDFRRIDLRDARFSVGLVAVHVSSLVLRGLPPWARASILSPWQRALFMALSLVVACFASSFAVRALHVKARFAALALGAAGPLGALGLLRALERRDAPSFAFLLLPVASLVCITTAAFAIRLWRVRTKVALVEGDC